MDIVKALDEMGPLPDCAAAFKVLEESAALIGIYDDNEVLRYSNAAFRAAYFVEADQPLDWKTLMRRNYEANRGTIIKTDNLEAWLSSVRSRRGKGKVRTYESDLHDGRWIWVVETMHASGWIAYVGTDVTALNVSDRTLRNARDSAMRESQTDELTGISNRRHIMSQLDAMTQSASSADGDWGYACLMDLDHFKQINDKMGHQVGDEVLINFARCVREEVRLRDAFGRVGGEEFLLLLHGRSLEEATRTVERVFDRVRSARFVGSDPDYRVTVSAGLTRINPIDSEAEVYARCDRGLYLAKESGRDQYQFL